MLLLLLAACSRYSWDVVVGGCSGWQMLWLVVVVVGGWRMLCVVVVVVFVVVKCKKTMQNF